MDKNTLSNYGWIVIAVLVLAVMIALATPFGKYIESGVRSTTAGLFDTSEKAMNVVGMSAGEGKFEDGYGETSTTNLPTKGKTLEDYTWAEVQQIVQAGKATEYGFSVGTTKSLTYNNNNYTAIIIGLDQDGANTATFMFTSSIGNHAMNNDYTNDGGFAASNMNSWLNGTAYGLLGDDVKSAITPVAKTNNLGYENPGTSSDFGKLFLLSVKEIGFQDILEHWGYYYMSSINAESSFTYTYFQTNSYNRRAEFANGDWFWLRSANSEYDGAFFRVDEIGNPSYNAAFDVGRVVPAFVIG